MFIGRKKELKQLSTELSSWKRKTAVLIYGKRRVGKSTLIQHIHDFDYFEASEFYQHLAVKDKISFYAIFGGCPYILENLDTDSSIKENIINILLPETSIIRSHIENIMLKEIQKSFDVRILEALGNDKKKYTEIREWIGSNETGLLDKQLKILLDMDTIHKTEPINRKNDKKSNSMRSAIT